MKWEKNVDYKDQNRNERRLVMEKTLAEEMTCELNDDNCLVVGVVVKFDEKCLDCKNVLIEF
jgi:hypothetical protein